MEMYRSSSSPSFMLGLKTPVECQECGCTCTSCLTYNNSLDLHHEIEELRSKLNKSNSHMAQMEQEFQESREFSEAQVDKLQDEITKLRDRYERLLETYKKSQKINHDLEDKLLNVVQSYEVEKTRMERELNIINTQLQDAKYTISDLEEECERYRNDCNVAVQLLQCKPSNFVAHKLNTLPLDIQQRVKCHLTKEEQINMEDAPASQEPKMIRVHMPTFPPTAMFYSVNKNTPTTASTSSGSNAIDHDINGTNGGGNTSNQNILHQQMDNAWSNQNLSSASGVTADKVPMDLIAKVLQPSESSERKHRHKFYMCNKCKAGFSLVDKGIQTIQSSYVDANGFPRTAVANFNTNPPTIVPHYPGVHRPRNNSSTDGEIINI